MHARRRAGRTCRGGTESKSGRGERDRETCTPVSKGKSNKQEAFCLLVKKKRGLPGGGEAARAEAMAASRPSIGCPCRQHKGKRVTKHRIRGGSEEMRGRRKGRRWR